MPRRIAAAPGKEIEMRVRSRFIDKRIALPVLVVAGLAGCQGWGGGDGGGGTPENPQTLPYRTLEQNWTPEERRAFYFTTQGSQILPYDWFLALEQPASQALVRDNANMSRLGYLVEPADPRWNPDGLPAGFVKDHGRDRDWLGLSCAACHTTQIDSKGVSYRIDGGAALADVRGFLIQLAESLRETRDREDKFLRFASKVLGAKDSPDARETLKAQLTEVINDRDGYNARNFPADLLPLYGRVDALGAILNEVFHHVARPPIASNTTNTAPANAPVSYPVLWDTPQHDVVQWNGAVKNAGVGALGRNVGEVLGVFGKFEVDPSSKLPGYASTVQMRNLLALEESVTKLWSPQWPEAFGTIDPALRDAGRQAFVKAKCIECHQDIDRTDRFRRVEARMQAVGTDDLTTANFDNRVGDSGLLKGTYLKVIGSKLLGSPTFGDQARGDDLLANLVIGTIIRSPFHAPEDELTLIDYKRKKPMMAATPSGPSTGGGIYKARPLNGIWASAPYLHNGSVPTLADLLLPAEKRPRSFHVGSREYDPVKVGFRTDDPNYPIFQARTDDGRVIPGNSNQGHEFGTEAIPEGSPERLDDNERRALLEYLKSL
jgi:hypothetical protein